MSKPRGRILYCDGGGWNGTHSRWAITDGAGKIIMYAKVFGHDSVTNNIAEYQAVINALIIAEEHDTIISDSQVVIFQLTKRYKCKAQNLIPLYLVGEALVSRKPHVKLKWVPRAQNVAGRVLDSADTKKKKVV